MEHTTHERSVTVCLKDNLDAMNANAVETEINEIINQTKADELVLDASELACLSSAGLHVIMRLIGRLESVSIIDTSDVVYTRLDMAGITGRARVRRRPRELAVDSCELIGRGVTASVYRLDHDTIAKVFNANISRSAVEDEYNRAKEAFLIGVPTAIAYETVRVGECYGTVFEMLEGDELLQVIAEDKDHLVEWVTQYARVVRDIHRIEVDATEFDDIRAQTLERIPNLEGLVATREEVALFARLYQALPDRHTFLHGDCHPGNAIVRDGELMLIDLADGGMGHPIIDLLSMCLSFKYMTMFGPETYEIRREQIGVIRPFTYEEACLIWDTFLHVYFDTDDEAFLNKAESQILAYAALKLLLGTLDAPGSLPDETVESLRQITLDYASHLEPVCF